MSTICGTLERILSCGGITRSGLRNHPGSLGHADGHDQRAHQARGDPGRDRQGALQARPRRPRSTSSTRLQLSLYTAPAPIVEYLSAASAVDAAPAPVVCFTRARREGPFSSCQRYAAPAPVVDNIAQFTHLTCLCVHFPCVCGAHSTGSRGVHQRLVGVVSGQRLRYVLLCACRGVHFSISSSLRSSWTPGPPGT